MSKQKRPTEANGQSATQAVPQITIDGVSYNLTDLSDKAKQQLGNVRLVDRELAALRNQLGIASVARHAYVQAVSAALPKEPTVPADGARSAVVNGVTYDWVSLGERVQGLLAGIRAADQELARINARVQLTQTARGSFAEVAKQNLPKPEVA
jgi:hypothetical protein